MMFMAREGPFGLKFYLKRYYIVMLEQERNNKADQREANCHIVGFQGKEANCRISKQLVIDKCVYQIHPIYNLYAASRDGKIIHIIKQDPNAGFKQPNGYMRHRVRKYGAANWKTLLTGVLTL